MIDVQAIFDKYIGQPVEAEDPTNFDQCFDWAFKYCDEIGVDRAAIRHLNAFDIFLKPNDLTLQNFDYIPNTPNGSPKLGDIVVFSTGVGLSGHVSVCQKADLNTVVSTDQNWLGHKYVEYINHPYDNIIGWLSPKVLLPPDTCPQDRDLNWKVLNEVCATLGLAPDPNDKEAVVAKAQQAVNDLQGKTVTVTVPLDGSQSSTTTAPSTPVQGVTIATPSTNVPSNQAVPQPAQGFWALIYQALKQFFK